MSCEPRVTAFNLGWDYAVYGFPVPKEATKDFCDGFQARRKQNPQVKKSDRFIRKWLQIRFSASHRDIKFDENVTPEYLHGITPSNWACPVLLEPMTVASGKNLDWSVERANNDKGYQPGNIIIISVHANSAKADKTLEEINLIVNSGKDVQGLSHDQWKRLALIIEPAFASRDDNDISPVKYLYGQPIAIGMPMSHIAEMQVLLAWIVGYPKRVYMPFVGALFSLTIANKEQRRSFQRLWREIHRRRTKEEEAYKIWKTWKIQKCLWVWINSLEQNELDGLKTFIEQARSIKTENIDLDMPIMPLHD